MDQKYAKSLKLDQKEQHKIRMWLLDEGLVENCKVPEHNHHGENVTVSEKGARVFIELLDFVSPTTLAELALAKGLEDLLKKEDTKHDGPLPPMVS
jgi:hypothetical protein